jgi:hypothetical protein
MLNSEELMEKIEGNIVDIKKYGVKRKQYILGSVKYATSSYFEAYLKEILDAIRKIENYTKDIAFDDFVVDELIQDGVVRNLEVIGEAVNNSPENIKLFKCLTGPPIAASRRRRL